MWKQWCGAFVVLVAGVMLAACVEDSSSSKSSSSGSSSSGSSSSCGYTDIVSSSERQQANSCGIQVSSQYAAADAYLEAAIESCRRGYKTEADSYYSNYQKQVEHARKVLEGLCGGSGGSGGGGGSFEDPTSAQYYNLCVARLGDNRYMGSCYGPVQYSDSSCPTTQPFNYISRHSSASACWDEWERRDNTAR